MTDRPTRLVLDTTAVLAYAHGSEAVGEIIREVVDEDAGYAIPVICLAEAAAQINDRQLPLHWPSHAGSTAASPAAQR